MSQNKYSQLRTRSKSDVDAEQLGFQVEEAEQQIASDILATKRDLSKAKQKLATAESAYPFVSKNIVDAEVEVEGLELGLQKLLSIQGRLFGATSKETEATDQKL